MLIVVVTPVYRVVQYAVHSFFISTSESHRLGQRHSQTQFEGFREEKMPQPNYDHIQTVEDLKNEVLSLQQHPQTRNKSPSNKKNTSLKRDQKALIQKNEDVKKQNDKLTQILKDMEINHLALHRNIQQLKTQVDMETTEFQMVLQNTLDKINTELVAKEERD
ncbi:hypothetical protein GBF38_004545 [Nibea albiflora]|uniref:Uncharacterized protein n=1 Tax=Nibea albiflora TaxID=240163 RepID=A0ACB7FD78_NIBAL|nr:hypothetical protein GBF38_004545 [Nibea albiflora]